jgi:short-subunit dehydrogenase
MVIGATGGIGRAFAEHLAAQGHALSLVARNRDRLEALATQLHDTHHVTADVLPADLAHDDGVRSVEDRIRREAPLRLLVNSAGIASWGRFADLDVERELDIVRVNVIAAIRLTKVALSTMLPRRQGAIVTVASLAGYFPLPFCATYGGTKAYLVSFTEALHEELRGTGVRIQVVCPGFTRTEMFARSGADVAKIPSFVWMRPETIARRSLAALRRGRPVCIPDPRARMILSLLCRLAPRNALRRVLARYFGNFDAYRLEPHAPPEGNPPTAARSPLSGRAAKTPGR